MSLSRGYIVLGFPDAYSDLFLERCLWKVCHCGSWKIRSTLDLSFWFFRSKTCYYMPITVHNYKLLGCSVMAKPSINKVYWHLYNRGEEKQLFLWNPIVSVTLPFSFNCRWFLSVPSCEGLHNVPVMKINKPQREPHPVKGNSILSPQFFCHIISL